MSGKSNSGSARREKSSDLLAPIRTLLDKLPKKRNPKRFAVFVLALIVVWAVSTLLVYLLTCAPRMPENYTLTEDLQMASDSVTTDNPEFLSTELLVKVTKASQGKIKEDANDTGVASLTKIFEDYNVKKFEKVVKENSGSLQGHELFQWYKITMDGQPETVVAVLDRVTNKLQEHITRRSEKSPDKAVPAGQQNAIMKIQAVIDRLSEDPSIEAVEPNYTMKLSVTPNDPYYPTTGSWGQTYQDMYGLHKMNAAGAWDLSTGSQNVIVAVIDTGVDRNHPDITANMWVNTDEVPSDRIDNDGNGYIDDYNGWDFYSNDNDPMDDHGHGTHCAGTIAAVGNNAVGVVGVNWTAKVMALKFLSSGGSGSLEDGISALQYAADNGARVSSNSWGSSGYSLAMDDAIKYEHDRGMVTVVAAGNNNADAYNFSPANTQYAVTVAASDYNDAKATFSNWGEKIDVAAPGVSILSLRAKTNPMCTTDRTVGLGEYSYCVVSGTSMATPHTAGLATLIIAKNPGLTNEQVRQILRTGADDLSPAGKDSSFGYGRINAQQSLNLASAQPLAPIITRPYGREVIYGTQWQFTGGVTGSAFQSYKLEAGLGIAPTQWTKLYESATQVSNGILATVDTTSLQDGKYIFRLTGTDSAGKSYQFQVGETEVDNFTVGIESPAVGGLVSKGVITIKGSAEVKYGLIFSNYRLEWGQGAAPTTWSTSGITLANGGSQSVLHGTLGTFDTTSFADGTTISLRLTVNATSGVMSQNTVTLKVDQDLVSGWPVGLDDSKCSTCVSYPVISDLNNDGTKEIVVLGFDNIYVLNRDGSNYGSFPVNLPRTTYIEFLQGEPTVVDMDNDGQKEIIVNAIMTPYVADGSYWTTGTKVYIFRSDGSLYPGWPMPGTGQTFFSQGAPVADVDGDGSKELVTLDHNILHVYKLNGTESAGFPKTIPLPSSTYQGFFTDVAIVDLDKDSRPEIAFAATDVPNVYLVDHQGNILPGFPYVAPTYSGLIPELSSIPSSGDVDGDGEYELLIIGEPGGGAGWSYKTHTYAINKDGTVPSGWPMRAGTIIRGGFTYDTPSAADVDADGTDEVFVGLYGLFMLENGTSKQLGFNTGNQPTISDINGDGLFEFSTAPWYTGQLGFYNQNGVKVWERLFPAGTYFLRSGVVADMNNNGKVEYVIASDKFNNAGSTDVYMWELSLTSSISAQFDWPMFSYDIQRSGRLSAEGGVTPPPPPPAGQVAAPTLDPTGGSFTDSVSVTMATTTTGASIRYTTNGTEPTETSTLYSAPLTFTATTNLKAKAFKSGMTASTTTSGTYTITTTPPPTGSVLHIGDLDGSKTLIGGGNWKPRITVKVLNASNNPVANVTVTGAWTGISSSKVSCRTGTAGTCTIQPGNTSVSSITFTVRTVTLSGYTYDASKNTDSDGDSNGTAITVNK